MTFGSVVFTVSVCLGLLAAGGPTAFIGTVVLVAVGILALRDGTVWAIRAIAKAAAALWRSWRVYHAARARRLRDIEAIEREMAALSPFSADFDFWALELHSVVTDRPRPALVFLPESAGTRDRVWETSGGTIRRET